jgi:hypothetical protein
MRQRQQPTIPYHQFISVGLDQGREGRQGGLAVPGFMSADHALRDACPGSHIGRCEAREPQRCEARVNPPR